MDLHPWGRGGGAYKRVNNKIENCMGLLTWGTYTHGAYIRGFTV